MEKKTKIIYALNITLFAIIFLVGFGAVYYFSFTDPGRMDLEWLTLYWMIGIAGALGIASSIKGIAGLTPVTRKISVGVTYFAMICCLFWLTYIYFLREEKPDAISQAFIWLFTIGTVSGLIRQMTQRRK